MIAGKKPLTGRAAKDDLMKTARDIASTEPAMGFLGVVRLMEARKIDTAALRIWATAKDKDDIDRLCAKLRASKPRSRR